MNNIHEYQKMVEEAKQSINSMMNATNSIMAQLSAERPDLFEQVSKDLSALRETKSIDEINKIMKRYANNDSK